MTGGVAGHGAAARQHSWGELLSLLHRGFMATVNF